MRWIWIDRFTLFESGHRAVAVKCVTLAEDHLHEHFPGDPMMPACLMIEGMAQTAGILCGEARGFSDNVILAKIRRAVFSDVVRPGETIEYEATMETSDESGAMVRGKIRCGDRAIGEVDLVFSHLKSAGLMGAPDENFVFNASFMELFRSFVRPLREVGGAA